MKMPTEAAYRFIWYLLIATIALASLLTGESFHQLPLSDYFDRNWTHFFGYMIVSTLPLLGWKRRTGMMISFGVALLSVALQILRALTANRILDFEGTIINLLGVGAGILLGLNITTRQFRAKGQLNSSTQR